MSKPVMTEQARADRIAELRQAGKSYGQIGAALGGVSASNISWICLKYGIDGPRKAKLGDRGPMVTKRGGHEVRRFTPEEDAKILEMSLAGHRAYAIGKVIGRPHNSVLGRQMTLARREERAMGDA